MPHPVRGAGSWGPWCWVVPPSLLGADTRAWLFPVPGAPRGTSLAGPGLHQSPVKPAEQPGWETSCCPHTPAEPPTLQRGQAACPGTPRHRAGLARGSHPWLLTPHLGQGRCCRGCGWVSAQPPWCHDGLCRLAALHNVSYCVMARWQGRTRAACLGTSREGPVSIVLLQTVTLGPCPIPRVSQGHRQEGDRRQTSV